MEHGNYVDVGKMEHNHDMPMKSEPVKPKKEYPQITIPADEFAYLCDMRLNDKCELKIKVRKIGENKADKYENDKSDKIKLEILEIAEPEDPYESLTKE